MKRSGFDYLSSNRSCQLPLISNNCWKLGIRVLLSREDYTSKNSFLDGDPIIKQLNYSDERISRGLYCSKTGILINSDVNGAYNIIKKAVLNAVEADRIEAVGLHPTRWRLAPVTSWLMTSCE